MTCRFLATPFVRTQGRAIQIQKTIALNESAKSVDFPVRIASHEPDGLFDIEFQNSHLRKIESMPSESVVKAKVEEQQDDLEAMKSESEELTKKVYGLSILLCLGVIATVGFELRSYDPLKIYVLFFCVLAIADRAFRLVHRQSTLVKEGATDLLLIKWNIISAGVNLWGMTIFLPLIAGFFVAHFVEAGGMGDWSLISGGATTAILWGVLLRSTLKATQRDHRSISP